MTVWQVSAGPTKRRYSDVLLRHGVALIGPGNSGPWRQDRRDNEFDGSAIRRFVTEVGMGDPVVMRVGTSGIAAVGFFAGEYEHLPQFDDVYGWDLQHARRVRWCRLPEDYEFADAVFGGMPARFSAVGGAEVLDYVERFLKSPTTGWQTVPLPALPVLEPALSEPPKAVADLVALAHDVHELYWNDAHFGERPREDELIVHFVVPLLRQLGWPPERIAVKWRNADVTVFRALPRTPEHVHQLFEAKRLGDGIEFALDQARRYLDMLGVMRDVIVTDGIRYRYYDAAKDFAPVAYANLANLKQSAAQLFDRLRRP
ncbi:MAG: hypothetical protein A3G24_09285 [Betaproteobacteria bacterium RIFCSPLOWO2_12_FULL_62_13]|nr:MAG: hypothetical protein A3G24_09285 [Betaproteobacteria bacterium RIFCSPLOWO2_12_FULL_62_13]